MTPDFPPKYRRGEGIKVKGPPFGSPSVARSAFRWADQELSACMTSPNNSQVSLLKRDSWTAWIG